MASLIAPVFLVTACHVGLESFVPHFQFKPWKVRQQGLKRIKGWDISGSFSVFPKTAAPVGASYHWQQTGAQYRIRVHAALNLYSLILEGGPRRAVLWQSDHEAVSAVTPEKLMQQQVGWHLPVSGLFYWLRGLPAPHAVRLQFDRYGHLKMVQQKTAVVRYADYITIQGVDVPTVIDITTADAKVKIVIQQWRGITF